MRARTGPLVILITLCTVLLPTASAGNPALQDHLHIPRVDGSLIEVHVDRPATRAKVPALIYIAGSLCIPSVADTSVGWLQANNHGPAPYSLVVVEKSGTTEPELTADGDVEIGPDFKCTDVFRKHYTIEQRVLDHLRVLQHLRRTADWWSGELLIWGFSDGGRIGAQLAAYYPDTTAVALVGFGGGTPMAESMEAMVCANDPNAAQCRTALRKEMDEIRAAPVPTRDWMGESNTYAAWASRLDAVETNILRDLKVPLLVVHGERDGSVPVLSARRLAESMQGSGVPFRYREVPGMGHSLTGGMESEQTDALRQEVLSWLTGGGDSAAAIHSAQ